MFISKNKFNRWQLSQKQQDQFGNELKDAGGNTMYANMNVQFKKGCEPQPLDLNKYGCYEIKEIIATDSNGRKRKLMILPNIYQDRDGVWVKDTKLYLGDYEFDQEQIPIPRQTTKVTIDASDLPF